MLYEMVLVADGEASDKCKSGMLLDGDEVDSEMTEKCPCTDESCDPCVVTQKFPDRGIQTMCVYLKCDGTTPFGMFSKIEVMPEPPVVEVVEEPKNETEPLPEVAPLPKSGSSLTMMDWYTVTVSAGMTLGAIIMSLFFYYHE